MYLLFYRGFGGVRDYSYLCIGKSVKVKEDELLLVVGQPVDELVEMFKMWVAILIGTIYVVKVLIEMYERDASLFSLTLAFLQTGGVESDAIDPCCFVAVATVSRPCLPKVGDYLLEKVVNVFGGAVGKGKANTIQDATRTAEHLLKLCYSFFFLFQYSSPIKQFLYIYVSCQNWQKVTLKNEFIFKILYTVLVAN